MSNVHARTSPGSSSRVGSFCAYCDKAIKPCAPCCRHTGWLHKHDNGHLCDPKDPTGHMAIPAGFRVIHSAGFR